MISTQTMSLSRQEREAQGQCPSCGQQLFHLEPLWDEMNRGIASSSDPLPLQRIPLSIPQVVERGQCLKCNPHQDTNNVARKHPVATAVYTGEYNEHGQKHGQGEMCWDNGDVYKGEFLNDVRQGHGTLNFGGTAQNSQDGGEYVGDWVNNQMHGSGTRRYPNGDVYMGQYVHGNRHGDGRFYYANGDMYMGQWKHNRMEGSGRYYYASGQRFEGTFVANKRSGKGKLQRTDGTIDIFQYLNDQRVGQGVRWSKDRTKAWRLWTPHNSRTGQTSSCASLLEKQRISTADAVSLAYQIEQAAASTEEGMQSTTGGFMS